MTYVRHLEAEVEGSHRHQAHFGDLAGYGWSHLLRQHCSMPGCPARVIFQAPEGESSWFSLSCLMNLGRHELCQRACASNQSCAS